MNIYLLSLEIEVMHSLSRTVSTPLFKVVKVFALCEFRAHKGA